MKYFLFFFNPPGWNCQLFFQLLYSLQDSGDLRIDSGRETLERITTLVNDTLANSDSYNDANLTTEDVLRAIDNGKSEGGSCGRHWVLDPIDGTKG